MKLRDSIDGNDRTACSDYVMRVVHTDSSSPSPRVISNSSTRRGDGFPPFSHYRVSRKRIAPTPRFLIREVVKRSYETDNVARYPAALMAFRSKRSVENRVMCLQYEFGLRRVTCRSVAIVFVNRLFYVPCAIRFCFKLGHGATETFQKL